MQCKNIACKLLAATRYGQEPSHDNYSYIILNVLIKLRVINTSPNLTFGRGKTMMIYPSFCRTSSQVSTGGLTCCSSLSTYYDYRWSDHSLCGIKGSLNVLPKYFQYPFKPSLKHCGAPPIWGGQI